MPIKTPEQNIYGLSDEFDTRQRLYYDTATWGAEVLDGSMRTPFEYSFDGKDLHASDGSCMRTVFEDAVRDADELARSNPSLAFEKRRRETEMEEYEEMLDMAAGNGPNTMVVVSEYPSELADASEDIGGYNHRRQQTMLRIISRGEEGSIRITSQSLDRSDTQGLASIYAYFGQSMQPGQLLGQRIRADVDPDRQQLLADELTREYDRTLEAKYGQQFYSGRTPSEKENTYDFVIAQTDLLEAYMLNPTEDNKLGFIAALDNRWQSDKEYLPPQDLPAMASVIHLDIVKDEMSQQAMIARQENKSYSGCGATLNAGGLDSQLESLGYGNKSKEEMSWHGGEIKEGTCVNCNEKTKVGKESWCKSCIKGHCG